MLLVHWFWFDCSRCNRPVSSVDEHIAIGAEGLGFHSRAGQMGHSVDKRSPSLWCFFETVLPDAKPRRWAAAWLQFKMISKMNIKWLQQFKLKTWCSASHYFVAWLNFKYHLPYKVNTVVRNRHLCRYCIRFADMNCITPHATVCFGWLHACMQNERWVSCSPDNNITIFLVSHCIYWFVVALILI